MTRLSPGVRVQPGQYGETISTKNTKISRVWWCAPVVSATCEAEAGESLEPGGGDCSEPRSRHCTHTQTHRHTHTHRVTTGQYIPEALRMTSSEAVSIDLNRPMKEVLEELGKYPVTTRRR